MGDPLRVGVVGAGENTCTRHIPGLLETGRVEIVSVCNRTPDSGQRAAERFGIPRVHSRWQDLVSDENIDAVVIGTWPNMHCPVTLASLAAGKHVLCEARMAMNVDEAREMLAAAQASPGLITQVVPAPMTLGVDLTVQRLLREGFLGELLAARIIAGGSFLDREAPLHWRQDRALSGDNLLTLGIWYECLMRWIGPAKKVFAKGRNIVDRRRNANGELQHVEIPDHVDVIAEFEDGVTGNLQFSAATGLDETPGIWLFGDGATLRFRGDQLLAGRRGDDRLAVVEVPDEEAVGWRVEAEFVGAIRREETVKRTTFADGVHYMQFTEAVHRSLASARLEDVG